MGESFSEAGSGSVGHVLLSIVFTFIMSQKWKTTATVAEVMIH